MKKKLNVADLLKTNSAKKPSKGSVPTEAASALSDNVYHAYVAYKEAESAFRQVEDELLIKSDAIYSEAATSGNFSKSFNLPGVSTPGVQVTYKDQFKAIPDENESELREAVGEDYNLYFETKRDIHLTDTSDETVALLVKKLGQEVFLRLFETKLTIAAKPDMDRRQFDLPDEARAHLTQYKASVKLGK